MKYFAFAAAVGLAAVSLRAGDDWVELKGGDGPGKGKKIVLIAGDEEYRSEEALPMLAEILSKKQGFDTTVLFSVDVNGRIDPNNSTSVTNSKALEAADLIVMLTRFRSYPDEDMKRFVAAVDAGRPIVALRTSTHAFKMNKESSYQDYSSFGKRILGEGWVSHWGKHKFEATRGIIEPGQEHNPILNGVKDVFGLSDVYEAHPPKDATILLRGQVLKGMNHDDEPADYKKGGIPVNDPMMPVAWTLIHKHENGTENRVFTTTMGAAIDLTSEDLRRLVINAVFWGLNMEVPEKADVSIPSEYKPSMYGFGGFVKGVKPSDIQTRLNGR